ncbi:hypothetical protein ACQPW1_10210 [Nocardia sp. CA-128927]|uniref:hypothetical protein n=1 Tax=Nocardia sp. CA-128927 TaxID=3239975 RepID=UPI003D969916
MPVSLGKPVRVVVAPLDLLAPYEVEVAMDGTWYATGILSGLRANDAKALPFAFECLVRRGCMPIA